MVQLVELKKKCIARKKTADTCCGIWQMLRESVQAWYVAQNCNILIRLKKKKFFSSILPPLDGLRILELGGGIGRFTTHFASCAKDVTVIDLSEQATRKNRERHQNFSNITYMADSVMDVQFTPQSFDLIFASWLLMYLNLEEINQLLHNCKNWLAPGGTVFFRESCSVNSDRGLLRHLFDLEGLRVIFRDTGGAAGDVVAGLIQLDQAYLTGSVMAELLHGAKGKREMKELEAVFATIPILDVTGEDWLVTGNSLQVLRKKGCTVPLTDVLIASVAQRNNMAVLTLDKHFQYLSVECVEVLEGS